jgi:hypothetical protein
LIIAGCAAWRTGLGQYQARFEVSVQGTSSREAIDSGQASGDHRRAHETTF